MRYFLPLFNRDYLKGATFYDFREAPLDSPPRLEDANACRNNEDVCVSAVVSARDNDRWIYTVNDVHTWVETTTSFVGVSRKNLLPDLEAIINSPWPALVLLAMEEVPHKLVLHRGYLGTVVEIDPDWVQYQISLDTLRLCNA